MLPMQRLRPLVLPRVRSSFALAQKVAPGCHFLTSGHLLGVDAPLNNPEHLLLDGASFSFAWTADSVLNSVLSDIDIRVRYTMLPDFADHTGTLIAKYHGPGARTFQTVHTLTEVIQQIFTETGAPVTAANSIALSFTTGVPKWIRVTWEESTDLVRFYTSSADDGETWEQEGSAVAYTALAGLFDGTNRVTIGASGDTGGSQPFGGKIYRAIVLDGIDGTVAIDFDPEGQVGETTWVGSLGETWTLGGVTSIASD